MKILRCFLFGLLTTSLVAAHAVSLDLSSFLGGDGLEGLRGMAVDAGGDIYAVGNTSSSDFPGADVAAEPEGAVFVSRIDDRGIVFTTLLDGRNLDSGLAIAVDDLGAAYVTGTTQSRNFPLLHAFQTNFNPGVPSPATTALAGDAFVAKLTASGDLVFSTFLGGRAIDSGTAIALDDDRRPYVAGSTFSGNFPTKNEFQGGTLDILTNAFLTVFAADGQSLVYSTQLGGRGFDNAGALAVDGAGNAYLAGQTGSRDFPVKNAFQVSPQGRKDAWVAKMNPAAAGAASLLYATYLGGDGTEDALGIAVDAAGQAHVTGITDSELFPLAAPPDGTVLDDTLAGDEAFVTKLNARGDGLLFSTFLGGSGLDSGNSIAVDGAGAVYVVGSTDSTDFQVVNGFQATLRGEDDAFVAKIDPLTSTLLWSSYLGGLDSDAAFGVALDPRGNVHLGGETASGATFPRVAAFQDAYGGEPFDGFVARIEATPPDTVGLMRESEGRIFMINTNAAIVPDLFVTLGQLGDLPVAGDWFGFGGRPGIFRDGTFILKRFTNDILCCNLTFAFGQAGDLPVAGDWNGDGIDTIGVFSAGFFLLRNSNSAGPADLNFLFGQAGDLPVAGDWDGDGIDTIGVFRPSTGQFFLRNTNDTGGSDILVAGFGEVGDLPVVGDWDGDGITTIGVFRGNQFLLRNSTSAGPADVSFVFGIPGDLPIAGDWNGRP
jgi:hypothetical protein